MLQRYIKNILINRRSAFIHDLLWVPLSLFIAYLLRFSFQYPPDQYIQSFLLLAIISVPIFAVVFWKFGLYRGIWRFASLPDLVRIVKAVIVGAMIVLICAAIIFRLNDVPRTVMILFPAILIGGLGGPRVCYRLFKDKKLSFEKQTGIRTLVIGAGEACEAIIRELNNQKEYRPVALVDDDPSKLNREIHGIRVVGGLDEITDIVRVLEITFAIFAIPSANRITVSNIIRRCSDAGIECKTLPTLMERLTQNVSLDDIRPFTPEDLLSRNIVQLKKDNVSNYLQGKQVLITGAGGSIGSELCRQVAKCSPGQLVLFDHNEYNLYLIDQEMRKDFPGQHIVTVLGDVKNKERVDWVFNKFSPTIVFHAAAYKHVPMIELNPAEGIQNNVIGTKIIAEAANEYNVEKLVYISTDKAVNPTSIMGATKRVAELFCQNLNIHSKTKFITTRFGNVLGSAGSVVPLFEKQIKEGGPVTVTHPKIMRYFMTIPESVSLILQAGTMGGGGEIFILDMGEPILIKELAEQMVRMNGLEPGKDIEIIFTGLRPGEKLYEEIFHESENLQPTKHPKLLLAQSRKVDWQELQNNLETLNRAYIRRDLELIMSQLKSIVPEYSARIVDNTVGY